MRFEVHLFDTKGFVTHIQNIMSYKMPCRYSMSCKLKKPPKVTVKEYGLTPALPSFLVLRRRSQEELINTEHPEYKVFMAVVDRAGVDARSNLLFQRAPDGEELVFDEEVIERVREGGEVEIRRTVRRNRCIHDELPLVAEKHKEFRATGKMTL